MPPLWQLPLQGAGMDRRLNELDEIKDTDSSTSIQYVTASRHSSLKVTYPQEAIVLLDYLQR
jgi:hypothetical protein